MPNVRNDREALGTAWSAVYSPATGETHMLLDGIVNGYLESGHLLYQRGEGFFLVGFDAGELRVTGDPVPYQGWGTELVDTGESLAGAAISRTGVLAYLRRTAGSELRTLAWVDRSGREESLPLEPALYRIGRVSPDGNRVVLDRLDDPLDAGSHDVWVFDRERSNLSPLVRDEHYNHYPLWSADGARIAFTSARDGAREIYTRAADGTGPMHRLTEDEISQWPLAWSADGRTMAVVVQVTPGGQGPFDIHLLSPDGEEHTSRPLSTRRPARANRTCRRTAGGLRTGPTSPAATRYTCSAFRNSAGESRYRRTAERRPAGPRTARSSTTATARR